jgi:glycine/D-amino acid oxidase-like deaminating enzyme
VREVGEVARRESIDCQFEHSGALEVAVNPAHLQRMRAELDSARGLGFSEADIRALTAAETTQRMNIDGALGALLVSHCAAIHPARLARGLAVALEKMGVRIFEQSPVLSVDGRVARTPHATITAETIILATEGYSRDLPGLKRRLIPMHSMMVATEPLSEEQLRGIHFKQRFVFGNYDRLVTYGQVTADQRIAFGCRGMYRFGSAITHRFDAEDPSFDFIRNTLLRFFPGLRGIAFTHAWGGSMGVSRRLSPSLNYDPATGQAWAGGFFGNGVGAAHLAGKTLADLVLKQDTERVHTPWVNPPDDKKKWEPEPLRWLGISTMAKLMHQVDRAEYASGRTPPLRNRILERLVS